ncbi:MAG TPA: antitoxin Xre/MbcA/ParS toxin-binding domain-containing protein [Paraburkholderia sp.]|jgi:putative toxin-antitoxin system antitoxin component (TIGR02293 family)|uniref:type II RES/Xre toxin-antitoxin system antitoxin n=1 Tax=Paraburkholderia sp. TaxID=1926495 RepID=UPI002B4894F8|nr:antitoxin Xre/MbcA/ParS toxin-binding domain-containing protein [Paraburkholderia sp.]HKR46604.1 antitoxin Xre/MbcA/ParS toxin-binding domain-containing protein [Paraburkholderia sp.]
MTTVEYRPTGRANPQNAEFSLLGSLLQAPIRSGNDLAALVTQRIGVEVLDRLGEHGLKAEELLFIIPRRTLSHRRQKGERLSTDESDKAIRLARIVAQAETVSGSPEKAMNWLRATKEQFAGKTPLEMAATEHGARLVEEALVQIDEGYFT